MKKFQRVLYSISFVAFYIGAIFFFIDGNIAAGVMGAFAGTLMLAALLMGIKKK